MKVKQKRDIRDITESESTRHGNCLDVERIRQQRDTVINYRLHT